MGMIYTVEGVDQNGKTVEDTVLSATLGQSMVELINGKGGNVQLITTEELPDEDED